MGVVGLIGRFSVEHVHIFAFLGVGDIVNNGKGFSHGDPSHEELPGIIKRGIFGAVRKVDSTSKVASIGAFKRAWFSVRVEKMVFAKKGKS